VPQEGQLLGHVGEHDTGGAEGRAHEAQQAGAAAQVHHAPSAHADPALALLRTQQLAQQKKKKQIIRIML
jgi:hypothetical protein